MTKQKKERNKKIDWLRVVGTLLVILAHVDPPVFLNELRSFDVVLLVFISGMTFTYNTPNNYKKYYIKRVKQLLIPTYITLTILFLLSYLMVTILQRPLLHDWYTIINSYLFLDGVGYIWITRVYLMLSIIFPFLFKLCNRIQSNYTFTFLVSIIFSIYVLGMSNFVNINIIIEYYLLYTVPYGLVALIGMRFIKNKSYYKLLFPYIGFIYLIIQLFINYIGVGFYPNIDKYPPGLYYIVYGLIMSLVLYKLVPDTQNDLIMWLSKKSFLIYLVHILILMGYNLIIDFLGIPLFNIWLTKYIIVVLFSVLLVYFIDKLKLFLYYKYT